LNWANKLGIESRKQFVAVINGKSNSN